MAAQKKWYQDTSVQLSLGLFGIGLFTVNRLFASQQARDNQLAELDRQAADNPGGVVALAMEFYNALGLFGLGDDEERVYKAAAQVPPMRWPDVVEAYRAKYGRSLQDDLLRQLDAGEQNTVTILRTVYDRRRVALDNVQLYQQPGQNAEAKFSGQANATGQASIQPAGWFTTAQAYLELDLVNPRTSERQRLWANAADLVWDE